MTIGALSPAELGLVCDQFACTLGGYGAGQRICSEGHWVEAAPIRDACLADDTRTKCRDLAVADYLGCRATIVEPSDASSKILKDPACAAMKACLGV